MECFECTDRDASAPNCANPPQNLTINNEESLSHEDEFICLKSKRTSALSATKITGQMSNPYLNDSKKSIDKDLRLKRRPKNSNSSGILQDLAQEKKCTRLY